MKPETTEATPSPGLRGAAERSQTPSGAAGASTESGRSQLRAMSGYAAQSEALAPKGPPPAAPRPVDAGQVVVAGSAGTGEVAYEGQYTPELIEALQQDPSASIAEVLAGLAARRFVIDKQAQHPTLAQKGDGVAAASGKAKQKLGVYVGNDDYAAEGLDLQSAVADAVGIQGALAAKGYQGEVHRNLGAGEMKAAYDDGAAKARPGDSLVMYYAGHGVPEGLLGVDIDPKAVVERLPQSLARGLVLEERPDTNPNDVLPAADVAGLASAAGGRGVNAFFISDSCHSGALADALRDEQTEELGQDDDALKETLGEIAGQLQDAKDALVRLVMLREKAAGDLAAKARGVKQSKVPITLEGSFDQRLLEAWTSRILPILEAAAKAFAKRTGKKLSLPGAAPSNLATFAAEIDAIDDMTNEVLAAASA